MITTLGDEIVKSGSEFQNEFTAINPQYLGYSDQWYPGI